MERAEAALHKAISHQEPLAREHPLAHLHRASLGKSYGVLAQIYHDTGQPAQQERSLLQALPHQEEAVRRSPKTMDYLLSLAVTYGHLSELLDKQPKAKVDRLEQAIGMFDKMLELEKGNTLARDFLAGMLRRRAGTLGQLGRSTEAVADWARAITIKPLLPDRVGSETERAYARAVLGQHAHATERADVLVRENVESWDVLLSLTAVYSLSAEAARKDDKLSSAERTRLADQYSARGVGVLARAYALGQLKDRTRLASLREDEDLENLRSGADFQKLLAEVEREAKQDMNPRPPGVQKK
jgi:tetratricopeptide (TPR) repeat protein